MDIGQVNNIKPVAWGDQAPSVNTGATQTAAKEKAAPVMTSAAVQQPESALAPSQVAQALQSINKALQSLSSNLEFTVDPDSNRTVVKVMDQQTKEVIRQMPSAEALEISKALDKLQGLLLRQKA
jgi:flagellar protein FlaG